jgi:sensor histidine kinase YesM
VGTLTCFEEIVIFLTPVLKPSLLSSYEPTSIPGLVAARIVSFVFVLGICRFKNVKRKYVLPLRSWIQLLVIPISTIVMLFAIFMGYGIPNYLIVICILGALLINLMTFYLYDNISSLMAKQIKEQLAEERDKHYEQQIQTMKAALQQYRFIRHDLKNRLSPLYHMAVDGELEKLKTELSALTESYAHGHTFVSSGNDGIDSVLNFKLQQTEKLNIKTTLRIRVPNDLSVSNLDMAVILGNLIDNSMEAVMGAEDRWIEVDMKYTQGCLLLKVSNSYDGIVLKSKGKFLSRKKEPQNHGLGLTSVETITEKYDGLMRATHDEKAFSVKLMLYLS